MLFPVSNTRNLKYIIYHLNRQERQKFLKKKKTIISEVEGFGIFQRRQII